jgi:hypothetical protein
MRHLNLHDNLSVIGAAADDFFFCWSLVSGVLLGWSRVMPPKVTLRFGIFFISSPKSLSRILKIIYYSKVLYSTIKNHTQT